MKLRHEIIELLPQTDCKRCGHDSCLVFAHEIAYKQCCIEACPDVSDEAERAFRKIIAAEHEMVAWLGGFISGIRKSDIKTSLAVLREIFFMFPVRIVSLLLFTFPLTYPFLAAVLWLYNK
jgi:Na+-translocating ferredoxin:NAD+ oxidoreductase RNF subunit RnfB